jgi:hypothetical protein
MDPMRAFLENSRLGLKTRFSTRWDSMFWLMAGSVKWARLLPGTPAGDKRGLGREARIGI